MYAGKAVELGNTDDIFYQPHHPYTWGCCSSIPRLDAEEKERLNPIQGLPPSLIHVPPGCAFHPRCPYASSRAGPSVPALLPVDGHHAAACHLTPGATRNASARAEVADVTDERRRRPSSEPPAAPVRRQPLLKVDGPQEVLPDHARHPVPAPGRRRARGRRRRPRGVSAARRSAWSASPAAASPRSRAS